MTPLNTKNGAHPAHPLGDTPPASIEAEQALLGCLLIDPHAIDKVREKILPADFVARGIHPEIFRTACKLYDAGTAVDLVTVQAAMNSEMMHEGGNVAYLLSLFDTVSSAANAEYYARIVERTSIRRQVWEWAQRVQSASLNSETDTDAFLKRVQQEFDRIAQGRHPAEWMTPSPFNLSDLPAFPTLALPVSVRGYVSEVASASQVPADMPGMLALAVVGAAGARRCQVQIGSTHSEPGNVWCAVVMEPGSRKSAVMDMTAPLRDYEASLAQVAAPGIASAKARRAIEEKHLSGLQDAAAKEKNAAKREDLTRQAGEMAADLTEVPTLPRLLADDVTPEKAAGLMAENAGTLALLSAEGGIFGILAGRYSGKGDSNLDVFLKSHAGDEIRVDRQGRAPDYIRRPALTMGLLVQPDVIASLSDNPSFRGRGLLGRFLYALPPSLAGTRIYQDRPVDPEARRLYNRAVERILDLPDAATEEDPTQRHSLLLTGEALAVWAEYADAVERRQAEGEDLAGIRDWASKLAGAVARIAGGFHLIENAGGDWQKPISSETVLAAWAVGEYLIPHALAAFGQMSADPRLVLARRILGWIERKKLTTFTLRDCQQAHKGGQTALTTDDLLPALAVLVDRGYIRASASTAPGTGGRPGSPSYTVNPATHAQAEK